MRINLAALFVISTFTLFAQGDSAFHFTDFDLLTADQINEKHGIEFNGGAFYESSSINSHMASDFLFSDRFTTAATTSFKDLQTDRTNLRTGIQSNLIYYPNWKEFDFWIGFEYDNSLILSMDKTMSELFLFGNKQFAGQDIRSRDNSLLSYERAGIKFGKHRKVYDKFHLSYNLGVSVLLNHQYFEASEIGLYTETEGEYLDVVFDDVSYYNALDETQYMGTLGLALRYHHNEKLVIGAEVQNLSWYFNNGLKTSSSVTFDTSFRFEGIPLSLNDLYNGGLEKYQDSITRSTLDQDTFDRRIYFMPSTIRVFYQHQLTEKHGVKVEASTSQWLRFGYKASASHIYKLNNKWAFQTTVSYGDFSGLVLTEQVEYKSPWDLNAYVRLYGINGAVAPVYFTAYGAFIGVFKAL